MQRLKKAKGGIANFLLYLLCETSLGAVSEELQSSSGALVVRDLSYKVKLVTQCRVWEREEKEERGNALPSMAQ